MQRRSRLRVGGLVVRAPWALNPPRLSHCLPPLFLRHSHRLRSFNRPVAVANYIVAEIMVVAGDHLSSGPSFLSFDHPPNA